MLLLVMIWSFTSRTHRTGSFWAQPVGIWFTVCSCMFPSAWTPPWKHVCPVHRNAVSCTQSKIPPMNSQNRSWHSWGFVQPSDAGRGRRKSARNYRKILKRRTRLETEHKTFSSHDSPITAHSRTDSRQQYTPLRHFQPSPGSQQTLVLAQIWMILLHFLSLPNNETYKVAKKEYWKSDVTFLPSS